MEVGKLHPVEQELSIEELNQLTAEPVEAEIDQLDVNSEQIPKLTIPEQHTKLLEILKIEHPDLTQAQRDVALELLLKNSDCFSLDHGELGMTKGIEVVIDTEGAWPI